MPIDTIILGNKLKRCRENLKLDIIEVSNKIGFSIERFQNIENGNVEPTGDEILILADFYKQDFRYFISNEKLSASEQVEIFYRKFGDEFTKEDRIAIQEFIFLCENEEFIFQIQEIEKLKFFNPLLTSKGIFKSQGVEAAKKLRASLGYTGKQLYKDIYSEFRKIGIHIFRRKLNNSNISGLFIKHPIAGKCILINYSDDIYRQNFTVAHEVGHALLDDNLEFNLSFWKESDFREYRANAFASSFLVPEEAFEQVNITWTEDSIIKAAMRLKVNVQTLLIALLNYKKITNAEYNKFIHLKIPISSKEDFELKNLTDKRLLSKKLVIERGLSDFYINKCYDTYRNGRISAGKLAEILLVNDSELPELLSLFNLQLHYEH